MGAEEHPSTPAMPSPTRAIPHSLSTASKQTVPQHLQAQRLGKAEPSRQSHPEQQETQLLHRPKPHLEERAK